MGQGDYKLKFKDLKARVGIDDVAYSLGYRLNRRAGVGRYIELVLADGGGKRDTIIVSTGVKTRCVGWGFGKRFGCRRLG